MKLPLTLSLYMARHFFLAIMLALFGLTAISMLIDIVELIRRAADREAVPLPVVIELAALRIPYLAEKLVPYAVLLGSMMALTRLTRTHELVVARSMGVSVWQFLGPAIVLAMAMGIFVTTAFNPLVAALLLRYEHLEGRYLNNTPSLLSISSSGLWLRQLEHGQGGIGERIIYTMRVSQGTMAFSNVMVLTFDTGGKFIERLDAKHAVLEPGVLDLTDVTRSVPGDPPQPLPNYLLPTTLTLAHIQDSFASPETMSFWHLPSFITMLKNAGFSALRHRMYLQSLLASPFLLAGSVLVAAAFSLRLPRRGRIGLLVVAGIISGFLLHFFTDIIFALGAAGTLPVMLAAWTPAAVVVMIGAALLLHLEDG
ncbi:MAG: LPS export ABC transporter permease LptG [Pseudomonadota bacterium]|nr:LPS export ABC transporter permease LptG [Pseudomonadota bacterium]MDE3038687.1 LPS export ABC transporter permease LptG [Pseudomonadota bacterium]